MKHKISHASLCAARASDDTGLEGVGERRAGADVANKDLILGVKDDEIARRGEEVVTATGEEVKGDDAVHAVLLDRLTADVDAEKSVADCALGVVDDLDVVGDLEPRGDGAAVVLIEAGDGAFEDGPELAASQGDLDNGVAEGERGQNLAAGDLGGVNGSTNTAGVDKGKVRTVGEADGAVEAVLEHGVSHDLAEKAVAELAGGLVKIILGSTDNLGSELLERSAPRVDQSLDLGILGCSVGQVGGSAMVGQRLALSIEGQVDVAQVLAPAVCGNDEDLIAIDIVDNGGIVAQGTGHGAKRGMAVATNNQGDTLGLSSEPHINIIAEMGEGNDAGDVCRVANLVNNTLDLGDGVEEGSELADAGDAGSGLGGGADDGDTVLLEDVVLLDVVAQVLILGHDVGGHDGEGQIVEEQTQLFVTTIPLVVAQGHDIILEQIDRLGDLLGSVERVEKGALELVAGIDDEVIRVVGAELVKDRLDTGDTTEAATLRAGAVGSRRGELV